MTLDIAGGAEYVPFARSEEGGRAVKHLVDLPLEEGGSIRFEVEVAGTGRVMLAWADK
jgi:ribosomal protein S5